MMSDRLGILLGFWFWVGAYAVVWGARKVIQEDKRVSEPDRSFFRRTDSAFFRLVFYFVLWCSSGVLLYALWIKIAEHGA